MNNLDPDIVNYINLKSKYTMERNSYNFRCD